MNVLIIGAGRMGQRHALGAIAIAEISDVRLVDMNEEALNKARESFKSNKDFKKLSFNLIKSVPVENYNIVIIATTAGQRLEVCDFALKFQPQYILIEKPLGQNLKEVIDLSKFFDDKPTRAFVNLNMRLYNFVKELKADLKSLPQFKGPLNVNFTGGSLGIGANGIHYLDLLVYLFDASKAELVSGEIEETVIPSGRGPQFNDFGGWACIKFFDSNNTLLGKSLIELTSTSTVFGGWEIIGTHGRIRINELEGERVDILRNPESSLPVNRYAADYLPRVVKHIESPALSDITTLWIKSLINNEFVLPTIQESLSSHTLLFDWLKLSKTHKDSFPIT